jgi:hypothetical protein
MANIIQTNIHQILLWFLRATQVKGCKYVDVNDITDRMCEEISILKDGNHNILSGGVVNQLFNLLDTVSIVTAYVAEYTNYVIQYSTLMDVEHVVLATEMSEKIDRITEEIKKIELKFA